MSFTTKDIKDWTVNDFMSFITSIGIKSGNYSKIKDGMQSNGLSPSDVRGTADDIKELFGIPKILAKKVKNKLDEIMIKRQINDNNNNNNNNNHNDNDTNSQKFKINLRGKQGQFVTLKRLFTRNSTIQSIAQAYRDDDCEAASYKLEKILLYSGGVKMDHNKILADYGIVSEMNRITVVFKTRGGAMDDYKSSLSHERSIKFKKYNLTQTSLPDCLIGYNDSDGIPRALLGCAKHGMTADTMYSYITTTLASNKKQKNIYCPSPDCKKLLDWQQCTQIADMSINEYMKWTELIEKRSLGNAKECPNCGAYCIRDDGVAIFRMNCIACNGPDWCWACAQPWKGSTLSMCNNQNCDVIREANEKLANAKLVKVKYIDVQMPEFRACPRCLTFIEYSSECKHMICTGCDKEFCFVCLSLKSSDGQWPCGSHTDYCAPASRQVFK